MARRKKKTNDWADVIQEGVALGAGSMATGFVMKGVKRAMPQANPKLVAFAPVAVGAFLMKTQTGIVRNLGSGLFASGMSSALSAFGIGNIPIQDDAEEVLAILQEYDEDIENIPIQGNMDVEYDEQGLPQ